MSGEDEGFATRWSKRKIAARDGEIDDTAVIDIAPLDNSEPGDADLTEADFEDVDFEALDKSSDYTRFIAANVPAAIQKKALRKLWASDPVFEVLDGMNDYDEDFTGNGLAGKIFETAHKVGRGFIEDDDVEDDDKKPVEAADQQDKAEFSEVAEVAKADEPADEPVDEALDTNIEEPEESA